MDKYDLVRKLEDLGRELMKLAVEYNEDYLTISYINETVVGCNGVENLENHISIFWQKEGSDE